MMPRVKDIMTPAVKTIESTASILEATRIMEDMVLGALVVVERSRAVGIITERDVIHRVLNACLDPECTTVREVMSSPLVTVSPDASIEEAAQIMIDRRIKKLPVLRDGRLIGIVTATDIVREVPHLREKILSTFKKL
ncbi:MAG: CBS domain-containing protein [Euryarchaeota archaeon]|nr:CBS domain-containing protein [Euryarchaeota archaeon]